MINDLKKNIPVVDYLIKLDRENARLKKKIKKAKKKCTCGAWRK